MSQLIMTAGAAPASPGGGMVSFFINAANVPAFENSAGLVQAVDVSDANGNKVITGNLTVSQRVSFNSAIAGAAGNQTANCPAGRVIAGIGATQVTVTNSYVTTSSIVVATAAANDTTGRVNSVVANAGNFQVNLTAPTANMPVAWLVLNY